MKTYETQWTMPLLYITIMFFFCLKRARFKCKDTSSSFFNRPTTKQRSSSEPSAKPATSVKQPTRQLRPQNPAAIDKWSALLRQFVEFQEFGEQCEQ